MTLGEIAANLVGFTIYFLVSLIAYIPVGMGSLEYHIWLYKASAEDLKKLETELRSVFRQFGGNPDREGFVRDANPVRAFAFRIVGTAVPVVSMWIMYFNFQAKGKPHIEADLLGTLFITIPILLMWKFGRGLRKYAKLPESQ